MAGAPVLIQLSDWDFFHEINHPALGTPHGTPMTMDQLRTEKRGLYSLKIWWRWRRDPHPGRSGCLAKD